MKRADGKPIAPRRAVPARPCAWCGEIFQPKSNRTDKRYCSQACYTAKQRKQIKRACSQCGIEFSVLSSAALRGEGRYCSRDCYFKNHPRPSLRADVADKISAAKTKHGKYTGRRQRQLEHAGMTLQGKGEAICRNCGADGLLHLHHAIPRSMWKAGVLEPLNGVPLCVRCHMGWHNRYVVIYRDVFTAEEWGFLCSADLLGQNVMAWLDERYPRRPEELVA